MEPAKRSDLDTVYEIMKASFPTDEMRPKDAQMRIMEDPACRVFVERENGDPIALVIVWMFDGFTYLEHFAVLPSKRGHGLGARILGRLSSSFTQPICVEVEPPTNVTAERRIAFYGRNGYKMNDGMWIQCPLCDGQDPVELRLMTYPEKVTDETRKMMRRVITERVFNNPRLK